LGPVAGNNLLPRPRPMQPRGAGGQIAGRPALVRWGEPVLAAGLAPEVRLPAPRTSERGPTPVGYGQRVNQGADPLSPPAKTGVDVALAEFNALRAELIQLGTAQAAFVGISLTALGVILGSGLNKDGDENLLLIVPPMGIVVILVYFGFGYRAWSIGDYIRTKLWPYLAEQVGPIHSWEDYVNAERRKFPSALARATERPEAREDLLKRLAVLDTPLDSVHVSFVHDSVV